MRSHAKASVVLIAVLALLAFAAPAANAAFTEAGQIGGAGPGEGGTGSEDGQFSNPNQLDVNDSSGNLYVADTGNDRVQAFTPNEAGAEFWTTVSITAPTGLAVDQGTGDVYVANASGIAKFDASLSPAAGWSDPAVTGTLAVDPSTGDLLVADQANDLIRRYNADGSADGSFAASRPLDLAATASGDVLVITSTGDILGECDKTTSLVRYSSGGSNEGTIGTYEAAGSVDVDPDDGSILVANSVNGYNCGGFSPSLILLDSAGIQLDSFELPNAGSGYVPGLAAAGVSERTYAVVRSPLNDFWVTTRIAVISLLPGAAIEEVNVVSGFEAELSGTVDPNGRGTTYRFEYRKQGSEAWTPVTNQFQLASGQDPLSVSAAIGVLPSTGYEARLLARNADQFGEAVNEVIAGPVSFSTPAEAPIVSTAPPAEVSESSARLRGLVNPGGAVTSYYFEWGINASYGQRIPLSPATVGSGGLQVPVSRVVDGLSPQTTYHYRIIAANSVGERVGADRSFTTAAANQAACPNEAIRAAQGSTHLPECMAWEKASPEDKNGGDAYVANGLVQLSADGSRIAWSAITSFVGGSSAPRVSDYLSVRSSRAWGTTNLTQPGPYDPVVVSMDMMSGFRWFDENLQKGIFIRNDGPGIRRNLYFREFDSESSSRLTPDPLSVPDPSALLFADFPVRDATDDLSHVLFEARQQLTPDAPAATGESRLYLWEEGELEFVGVLPDGSPAPNAVSGRGGNIGSTVTEQRGVRDMSDDGSRIFFTVPKYDRGFRGLEGEIFMREGDTTVHVSASQRSDCAEDPSCGGDGEPDPAPDPDPASSGPLSGGVFGSATDDGDYVFFKSCVDLTDDSDGSCGDQFNQEIYRYEVGTGELTNLTAGLENLAGGPKVEEFIEAGEGGDNAFFIANVGGIARSAAYVWREGVIEKVGDAGDPAVSLGVYSPTVLGPRLARISPDGRYFAWGTDAPLTGTPSNGNLTLYLYDAVAGSTVCISCPSDGSAVKADSTFVTNETGTLSQRQRYPDVINEEDGWILFETGQALAPRDTNGDIDVYRFVMATGEHQLLSSGSIPGNAHVGDVSADGSAVAIVTRQQLVGSDRDNSRDVYAVRMSGGLPEPEPPAPPCVGDECQGASPPRQGVGTLGTAAESGMATKTPVGCAARKKAVLSAKKRLKRADSAAHKRAAKRKLRDARKRHTTCIRRAGR